MDPKTLANRLARQYGTRDPFRLAAELGISVFHAHLGSTWGYSVTSCRIPCVCLSDNLDEKFLSFTLAHEIGHFLLHRRLSFPFLAYHTFFGTDHFEREANTFAVELLLPDEILREYPDCPVSNLARLQGIPEKFAETVRWAIDAFRKEGVNDMDVVHPAKKSVIIECFPV